MQKTNLLNAKLKDTLKMTIAKNQGILYGNKLSQAGDLVTPRRWDNLFCATETNSRA